MPVVKTKTYKKKTYRKYKKPSLYKMVSNMIQKKKETKHLDLNANLTYTSGIGNAGSMVEISAIPQGDTESSREGLQIYHNSIHLDLNFVNETGGSYNKIRLVCFKWDDDTLPVASTFFATGYSTYVQTPYSWPLDPKMKIIFDKKILVDNDDPTTFIRVWKKLNGKCRFTGSASNSGIQGRIFLFIASDSIALPHPTCTGYVRYTYKEA